VVVHVPFDFCSLFSRDIVCAYPGRLQKTTSPSELPSERMLPADVTFFVYRRWCRHLTPVEGLASLCYEARSGLKAGRAGRRATRRPFPFFSFNALSLTSSYLLHLLLLLSRGWSTPSFMVRDKLARSPSIHPSIRSFRLLEHPGPPPTAHAHCSLSSYGGMCVGKLAGKQGVKCPPGPFFLCVFFRVAILGNRPLVGFYI